MIKEMEGSVSKKIKHNRKSKSKISFDEEVVTKDYAKKLVCEGKDLPPDDREIESMEPYVRQNKRNPDRETNITIGKKKKLVKEPNEISMDKTDLQRGDTDIDKESENIAIKEKKESVRGLKRKKHAKLMEYKKVKVELEMQQKALNYLSKWKHSKSEWKFEKLRQVWLQQNLFDASRIPNDFWDTAVQYFSGSKGQSRQSILDHAIKCIDEEEKSSEENTDEGYQSKLRRARDIVQHLE